MRERIFIGADIHQDTSVLALYHTDSINQSVFPVDPEIIYMENRCTDFVSLVKHINELCPQDSGVAVLVETSSVGSLVPLVYFLQQQGYRFFQIRDQVAAEARERLFGHESKTDKLDAIALGLILYLHEEFVFPFPVELVDSRVLGREQVLRLLVSQRWALVKMRTQITNRLRPLMAAVFPEAQRCFHHQLLRVLSQAPVPEDLLRLARSGNLKLPGFSRTRRTELLSLAEETVGLPGDSLREVIRTLAQLRQDVEAQCRHLGSLLEAELKVHPATSVLMSFPGMGIVIAATLLGAIGDIRRWKSLAAFRKGMGIYGEVHQSGNASPAVRRGKGGSRSAKRALYQLAVLSLSPHVPDNDFRDYHFRLVAKGKNRRKAMYSTMSKLAKIIYHCLREGIPYEYQKLSRRRTGTS